MTALAIMRLVPRPGRIEATSRVLFEGRDLQQLPVPEMRSVRGSRIGMIFQEPMTSLNPVTPVGDQVMEVVLLHATLTRAEARRRVLDQFGPVGIPTPERRFAATNSRGRTPVSERNSLSLPSDTSSATTETTD